TKELQKQRLSITEDADKVHSAINTAHETLAKQLSTASDQFLSNFDGLSDNIAAAIDTRVKEMSTAVAA
ncbi:hypothetical protein AB9K17_23975, partial [Salmonella enterica subsp. enterica serovar Kentucky]|uniref:hypothetical protein n=1 Tax=Salmonella enterica TaxID=28901 RepID=UPI003F4C482D